MQTFSGLNQNKALRWARRYGCRIEQPRRSGEIRVSHPQFNQAVRINGRRKDASRCLTTMLNRLAEQS